MTISFCINWIRLKALTYVIVLNKFSHTVSLPPSPSTQVILHPLYYLENGNQVVNQIIADAPPLWHNHTVEYYSATKENGTLTCATK